MWQGARAPVPFVQQVSWLSVFDGGWVVSSVIEHRQPTTHCAKEAQAKRTTKAENQPGRESLAPIGMYQP